MRVFFFAVVFCTQTGFASEDQIIGENNLEPIEVTKGTEIYEWSRAIAYAKFSSSGCTSFRLTRDLFMTNHHCYQGTSCQSTRFILGLEKDLPKEEQREFLCEKVESKDYNLDYALYRVRPSDPSKSDSYPSLTLTSRMPEVGAPLLVPGFPCCVGYKRIDISENCALYRQGEGTQSMKHTCDSISGSSGSPILNRETGEIIGIHYGYSDPSSNDGSQMHRVIEHIRTNAPSV